MLFFDQIVPYHPSSYQPVFLQSLQLHNNKIFYPPWQVYAYPGRGHSCIKKRTFGHFPPKKIFQVFLSLMLSFVLCIWLVTDRSSAHFSQVWLDASFDSCSSAEWLCAKQAEIFFAPTKVQKCKSALRDKMQTSVDIFLAAGASKQPARERNN